MSSARAVCSCTRDCDPPVPGLNLNWAAHRDSSIYPQIAQRH